MIDEASFIFGNDGRRGDFLELLRFGVLNGVAAISFVALEEDLLFMRDVSFLDVSDFVVIAAFGLKTSAA